MADYDTITKILVGNVRETQDSSIAGSFAKQINDYWELSSRDDSDGEVKSMEASYDQSSGNLIVTITSLQE